MESSQLRCASFFRFMAANLSLTHLVNCGHASVVCITHGVFLFRIRKDPFNGFFPLRINPFALLILPDALHNVQIFLPDVSC